MKILLSTFLMVSSLSILAETPTITSNPLYALTVTINTEIPSDQIKEEIVATKIKLQNSSIFEELRASKEVIKKRKSKIYFSSKKLDKAMTIVLEPKKKKISKNYGIKKSLLERIRIMFPELSKEELKTKIIEDLIYLE